MSVEQAMDGMAVFLKHIDAVEIDKDDAILFSCATS
jgi:hypothetical protein